MSKKEYSDFMLPDGYRLPAEWEKHSDTFLAFPHNKKDWPNKFAPIPWVYVEIIRKIVFEERVIIACEDADHENKINDMLLKAGVNLNNVFFVHTPTNRSWVRDTSPLYLVSDKNIKNERIAVSFSFNAWAKYKNFKKDSKLPATLAKKLNIPLHSITYNNHKVVLEGGAIDVNGKGTLVTTEECLLDEKTQVRNPGFSKKDYEQMFKQSLGIEKVIWLGKGIMGDDTHGHVDDLCRFVSERTLVICHENNPADDNYTKLEENLERLKDATLQDGSKPEIITLPMPTPLYFDGERLPASYANFYIANHAVLVPTFNCKYDRRALGILAELFPDRKVVGIHAVDLVWGFGTIHCLSSQIPSL